MILPTEIEKWPQDLELFMMTFEVVQAAVPRHLVAFRMAFLEWIFLNGASSLHTASYELSMSGS